MDSSLISSTDILLRQSLSVFSQVTQATHYTLTLSFSPHLQSLFEDAARAAAMSVVEWAQHPLKIAALSARRANQLSGRGQN
jgi:hypothetical protein